MILDRFKLDGKVAIVTGAGRGIGRGTALALAEAGADVVCAARTLAQIEETAELVRERGRRALAVTCDVNEAEQLASVVERAASDLGRIDVVVNNAGGTPVRPCDGDRRRLLRRRVPLRMRLGPAPHALRGAPHGQGRAEARW